MNRAEISKITKSKTNILIIEDLGMQKYNLKKSLEEYIEFNIIDAVNNINSVFYKIAISEPEVIIVNSTCLDEHRIENLYKIREFSPYSKIIIMAKSYSKNEILELIATGVNAFCLTSISINAFSLIIKAVVNEARWFDPVIVPLLLSSIFKFKGNIIDESMKVSSFAS